MREIYWWSAISKTGKGSTEQAGRHRKGYDAMDTMVATDRALIESLLKSLKTVVSLETLLPDFPIVTRIRPCKPETSSRMCIEAWISELVLYERNDAWTVRRQIAERTALSSLSFGLVIIVFRLRFATCTLDQAGEFTMSSDKRFCSHEKGGNSHHLCVCLSPASARMLVIAR